MKTILLMKAGSKGWQQERVPSHKVVRMVANGYHIVPNSLIVTKEFQC